MLLNIIFILKENIILDKSKTKYFMNTSKFKRIKKNVTLLTIVE